MPGGFFVKENIGRLPRTTHQTLKCIYTNLDGLANKTAELQILLSVENPDIIFLTETKCNGEVLDSTLFDTNQYSVIRKDRVVQHAPGGGVAILVKKHLLIDVSSVCSLVEHEAQESVWCVLKNKEGRNLLLGTIYRSPSSAVENNDLICDLIRLSESYSTNSQILVCGDFNYGNINWEENRVMEGTQGAGQAANFLEAVNDNFWTQNVEEWTHLRDTDHPSRLDLVFTKTASEIDDVIYLAPLGLSKHAVLCFSLTVESKPEVQEDSSWKLNFHKADNAKMRDLFRRIDWTEEMRDKTASQKWDSFRNHYDRIVEICVPPQRKRQQTTRPKWMNATLDRIIKRKRETWNRYRAHKTPGNRDEYKRARNTANLATKTAKYEYERKVARDASNNTKHFWAYVRSKTAVKETITKLKTPDGIDIEGDRNVAQEMNSAFNAVFVREETSQGIPTPSQLFQGTKLHNITITREEVKRHLSDLNGNKAPGPDGISPHVLKQCADILCTPLKDIFATSLRTGDVPQDWRRANISPIYKKGSKTNPLNYRPVSLTSIASKVVEKMVTASLVQHLTDNGLITQTQHGFCNKGSCPTNMQCHSKSCPAPHR